MTDAATHFPALVERAVQAAEAYYNGREPIMSDEDYDALIELIEETLVTNQDLRNEMVDALLTRVAAGTAVVGDIEHVVPMLSLNKTKHFDELASFVAARAETLVVEPKVDGIAAVVRYEGGQRVLVATRGDGSHGEDITANINTLEVVGLPKNLGQDVTLEVRGELHMSPSDFDFSNAARVAQGGEPFKNPRNATSGIVMRETVRHEARISFAAYEVVGIDDDSYTKRLASLPTLGIKRAVDLLPGEFDFTASALEQVKDIQALRQDGKIPAPLDGAVIKMDSYKARESHGNSSRHPRWALAFKYPAIEVSTRLVGIIRTVGRTGNIAYTAALEPVLVDGSVVSRSTLHNADFIATNDLRINDTVILYKAGDVIPRVEKALVEHRPAGTMPYVPPTTCPQCDEELDRAGAIWRCHTPSCSIVGLLTYAVSRDAWDVDGFSTAIAEALVESGKVNTLSDLFYLTEDDLSDLVMGTTSTGNVRRLGVTTAKKIMSGIEAAKSQPLHRTICALGIRMTGRSMSRRIAVSFPDLDAVLNATASDFMNRGIEGVGVGRATAFVKGFAAMRSDIERMKAAGVNMVATIVEASPVAGSSILADKKVVVTGSMKGALAGKTRNEVEELLTTLGAKSSSSVSKSTDLLIVGENAGSKLAKAQTLGVRVITEAEFAAEYL